MTAKLVCITLALLLVAVQLGTAKPAYADASFKPYTSANNYASIGPGYPQNFGYNPNDFFTQYFAALQAQQQLFQQQLQAQIYNQQQALYNSILGLYKVISGSVAPSHSTISGVTSNNHLPFTGGIPNYSSFPFFPPMNFGAGAFSPMGGFPTFGSVPNFGGSGIQSASASGSIGPGGGFQQAQVSPGGIDSRFGESIPPSNSQGGGFHGVFSSSSSNTHIGPDGKPVTQKEATVGVNNNGKVSIHKVHDP